MGFYHSGAHIVMERSKRVWSDTHKIWPGMDQMISDYDKLEKMLRDTRNILACIAWQQDDKTLTVPVAALQELPPGCELEVSYDRVHENYNFTVILAGGIPAGNQVGEDVGSA